MEQPQTLTLSALLSKSVQDYQDLPCFSFVDETPYPFREFGKQVGAVTAFLQHLGIGRGDKVAILGHNMPTWGVAYFAVTTMGAVAVPLLPDFSPAEVFNVLNHSESRVLFISSRLTHRLEEGKSVYLEHIVRLEDFSVMESKLPGVAFDPSAQPAGIYVPEESDLAAIIYTSGTTGRQKGVMLSHRNIVSNAIAGGKVQYLDRNDIFLSLLPLSHVYENTLGLVLPVLRGCSVVYMRQPISPQLIADALTRVRPTVILSVPMIIEKMYRGKILPGLKQKKIVWLLYRSGLLKRVITKGAGKKLMAAFGGRLRFFGIGGAKLDPVVERFLMGAGFPIAIGYGLTESSPLLAGTNPHTLRWQSTGPAVEGVELKLNLSGNQDQGEIWAKGPNIMLGYYKDPDLTAEVLTEDGWLKTGDLGSFDKNGYLFIIGRLKNTILGSNGENIYPEEIESLINNFRHVVESVVIEQKGKLVALVHINREEIEKQSRQLYGEVHDKVEKRIEELRKELQDYVNSRVNRFSRLHAVVIHPNPFQKTATQKIKRYLYH